MTIWDDRYKSGEGLHWWPNEELVRFLGKTYPDRVVAYRNIEALDLGCAPGNNLWALWDKGMRCRGVEQSDDGLLACERYFMERMNDSIPVVSKAILPSLTLFADSTFDLVVDCQTIQHLSVLEHIAAYDEVMRVLKPGGRFWSMHFADGNPDTVYGNCYPELQNRESYQMKKLYANSGLRIESLEQAERSYEQRMAFIMWWIIEAVKP